MIQAKWEDVLTIRNGRSQKKVLDPRGKYPIYGSGGVMGYANDYLCEENTVVIGRKGSINSPIYVEEKFWNVDTAFGLCANEKLFPKYLFYFCLKYNFEKHNKATTLPSLTKSDLLKIKIPLPPLPEQQRIAELLDQADQLRRLHQEQLQAYDELAQSVFLDMFGDPVKNEKGWEVVTFLEVAEKIQMGPFGSLLHKSDYISDGVPIINPVHIVNGKLKLDSRFTISNEKANELSSYFLIKGDVIIGRRGEMGRCAVIGDEESGSICGTGSIYIRLKENVLPVFASKVITSPSFKSLLESKAKGVTMLNLSRTIVKDLPIIVPPHAIQEKFVNILANIGEQKAQLKFAQQEAEDLFQALLQEVFGP